MAPCNNVKFTYGGSDPFGQDLARLLGDMAVRFECGEGLQKITTTIYDVAALLAELHKKVIQVPSVAPVHDYVIEFFTGNKNWQRSVVFPSKYTEEQADLIIIGKVDDPVKRRKVKIEMPVSGHLLCKSELFCGSTLHTTQTPVPTIEVPLAVSQFLKAQNVRFDTPVTLIFKDSVLSAICPTCGSSTIRRSCEDKFHEGQR